MLDLLKKLFNELPTIFVAIWAILRAAGVEVDASVQEVIFQGASSVMGFAIWMLVRNSTDGPVTALERKTGHSPRAQAPSLQSSLFTADDVSPNGQSEN